MSVQKFYLNVQVMAPDEPKRQESLENMIDATLETHQTAPNDVGEEMKTLRRRNNRGTNVKDRESSSMTLKKVSVREDVVRV